MKTFILLIVWLAGTSIHSHGQQLKEDVINCSIIEPQAGSPEQISQPPAILVPVVSTLSPYSNATLPNVYYLKKSLSQKINGLVLFTGGSLVGYLGIRSGMDMPGNSFSKNPFQPGSIDNNSSYKMALTGLVLMAGSIPYFIHSMKNKHKAGLKLTCQKTAFGASNKACKKVTGLTFAIPLGK